MDKQAFYEMQRRTYDDNKAKKFDVEGKRANRNHINKIKAINNFLRIGKGEKVLEVGVGTGIHARCVLDFNLGLEFDFYGVDISAPMLSEAKNKLNGEAVLIEMNGEELKFKDDFFDKVYISGSLHHYSDPNSGIKEIIRVLKPGGKFCIMEPNILFPTNFFASRAKAEEYNMRLMKKKNFDKWLGDCPDVQYVIENFAYTPPFPKHLIGFYDILDKILAKIPLLNRVSVMLFTCGTKKDQE